MNTVDCMTQLLRYYAIKASRSLFYIQTYQIETQIDKPFAPTSLVYILRLIHLRPNTFRTIIYPHEGLVTTHCWAHPCLFNQYIM